MDWMDALVLAGLAVVGVGLWMLAGWPLVLVYGGSLIVLAAVAAGRGESDGETDEVRRQRLVE